MANISELLSSLNALYDTTKSTTDIDFFNKLVQFEDDPNNVASADATIIFSGPPVYSKIGTDTGNALVPIGAVQGFNESETNGIMPFAEIGSRLKRTAASQAQYQLSLQRVLSYHSNLRYACYAWVPRLLNGATADVRLLPNESVDTALADGPASVGAVSGAHFTTFESDIFRLPFGLMLATMTANGKLVSREYYERCQLLNAGKSVAAGQPMIQESVSIYAVRKVPAPGIALSLDSGMELKPISFPVEPAR
jgi:hypothetical protein